jgi:hypothetical protein
MQRKSRIARFPGHEDKHKSFSVFKGDDGFWHWKCHSRCGDGDEIMFLGKLKKLSLTDAMNLYFEEAGFPACAPHKSREYPKSPDSPESRKSPESLSVLVFESPYVSVSPVSEGQELMEVVRARAARNACKKHGTASKALFGLARDMSAVEKRMGREAEIADVMPFFDEWYRISQGFLDPKKTRDDYLAEFVAALRKVRVPTGEGDTVNKALEALSKLSPSKLPTIPGMPTAPESWRRVAALHREMFRRTGSNRYFLSCRDTAKASPGLS